MEEGKEQEIDLRRVSFSSPSGHHLGKIYSMTPPAPSSSSMLYKILTPAEFSSLPLPPSHWLGTTFDLAASPRAINLATSLHVPSTLAAVYPNDTSLWILAIPRTPRMDAVLRWNINGEGGAQLVFPPGEGLDVWSEVAVRRPISKGEGGEWDLGDLEW